MTRAGGAGEQAGGAASDCAPRPAIDAERLELSRAEPTRYHKVSHDPAAIESLFVDLFLDATRKRRRRSSSTSMPRRSAAWQPGRQVLPWLLQLLLLPAALHLLRPPPAGGQTPPLEHRRPGRGGGGVARIVAQIRRRWPRTLFCCVAIAASRANPHGMVRGGPRRLRVGLAGTTAWSRRSSPN